MRHIPKQLKEAFIADTSISYAARQRLNASFTAWLNRVGPVNMVQKEPGSREMVTIPENSPQAAVADAIDALQTALVAAVLAPQDAEHGMPNPPGLIAMLRRALNANPWHP